MPLAVASPRIVGSNGWASRRICFSRKSCAHPHTPLPDSASVRQHRREHGSTERGRERTGRGQGAGDTAREGRVQRSRSGIALRPLSILFHLAPHVAPPLSSSLSSVLFKHLDEEPESATLSARASTQRSLTSAAFGARWSPAGRPQDVELRSAFVQRVLKLRRVRAPRRGRQSRDVPFGGAPPTRRRRHPPRQHQPSPASPRSRLEVPWARALPSHALACMKWVWLWHGMAWKWVSTYSPFMGHGQGPGQGIWQGIRHLLLLKLEHAARLNPLTKSHDASSMNIRETDNNERTTNTYNKDPGAYQVMVWTGGRSQHVMPRGSASTAGRRGHSRTGCRRRRRRRPGAGRR